MLGTLTIDGRLYGLPRLSNAYDALPMMFVRQDWLDRLGLGMPATMDELMEVARAFTYSDPDGNGANDTYGLAIDGVDVFTGGMGDANAPFYAFGAYPGPDAMAFIEGSDGKVAWGGANAEGMKKALVFLQEMYKDGSLAKDFITMDSQKVFEEAGSGRCGIWFGPMWGAMQPSTDLMRAGFMDAHVTSGPIPDGLGQGGSRPFLKASIESVFMMSSKCENPEALIKLMNLSIQKMCFPESDDEYNKYAGIGDASSGWKCALTNISGMPFKNYDVFKTVYPAVEKRDPSGLSTEQASYYKPIVQYLDTLAAGAVDLDDGMTAMGIQRYTVFADPQGSYAALDKLIKADQFVYSAYSTGPTKNMAEFAPTLKKLTAETIVKIITGESADTYDSFLENWRKLGGTEVVADAQAWADAQ